MEEIIIWKSIKEEKPKEGQQILYLYSYEYEPGKWERRVLIGKYNHSEMRKYPMCYITLWADASFAVLQENQVEWYEKQT